MAHYAISKPDGSVAILQTIGDATVEDCLAKWPPDERAQVVSHAPVDPTTLPQDRSFRNAWTLAGNEIVHDMVKAREIKRAELRRARAPQLAALDIAYQRADESKDGAAKAGIAARKQALRDATVHPSIEAAATVEDLKAISLAKAANF